MKHQNYYDVLRAYQLLFSVKYGVNPEMLRGLKINSIKSAYKQMAMKSHPDRAVLLGVHRSILEKKFKEINEAYSLLASVVEKGSVSSFTGATPSAHRKSYTYNNAQGKDEKKNWHGRAHFRKNRHRQHEEKSSSERNRQYSGTGSKQENKYYSRQGTYTRSMVMLFPMEELMLGQFLYYSGHISLMSLVTAIQWQRGQRPSFGKIAMDWRILNHEDIITILKNRQPREKFGQCSMRLGLVSSFQYKAVLCKQKNLQRPIGEYFIHQGLLSKEDMDEMQKKMLLHNRGVREYKSSQP